MTRRALLPAVLALATLPTVASAAAPVPDRVLEEVSSLFDVGIDGTAIAYTHRIGTRGSEVVVRDGDRPIARLAAGRGDASVAVGHDGANQPVVVFDRCATRCSIVAFSPRSGHSRTVVPLVKGVTDVAVGGGRVFWADGRRARSHALAGGHTRREAVAPKLKPTELNTGGVTLAVTGDLPGEFDGGATGVSVTRVGSGRARLRASRNYSEEYAGFRAPVVTGHGITTLFDHFVPGVSANFADLAPGKRGWDERGSGAMQILAWDADGSRAVFVEAPSNAGCALGEQFSDQLIGRAPCRIVLADLSHDRLLPPQLAIAGDVATVSRPTVHGSTITSRLPEVGIAVQVRDGAKVVASLTTDAQGKVALPDNDSENGLSVIASTTPTTYAYYAAP